MTNQVPKTDGRGFPSGAYLNQNHPMDRTQWLEDTFPEWGSFLNQEIENYEVPKEQVSLWWCGGPSWVLKTDEGGVFMIDQYCGPSMYTELYYCGVCKQAGADSINWIRLNPQVIDPWKFNHIDGIFCTHAHQEHCDLYAVKAMTATTDAPFYAPPVAVKKLQGFGVPDDRIVVAKVGESVKVKGAEVDFLICYDPTLRPVKAMCCCPSRKLPAAICSRPAPATSSLWAIPGIMTAMWQLRRSMTSMWRFSIWAATLPAPPIR